MNIFLNPIIGMQHNTIKFECDKRRNEMLYWNIITEWLHVFAKVKIFLGYWRRYSPQSSGRYNMAS